MRVVAINASRKRGHGPASLLLDPFLDGLREEGAEVELFYARDLMIIPGGGHLNCAVRMPGKRRARGGMRRLRRKISRADILVLASPLYCDGRTGPEEATSSLRRMLEGLVPGTKAPAGIRHEPGAPGKAVIASGSGFWEIDGLCPVLKHTKALINDAFPGVEGKAAGPGSVMILGAMPRGLVDWDVIGAAHEAGCQLAVEEATHPVTHDIDRREAVTREFFNRIIHVNALPQAVSSAAIARDKCAQKDE